MSTELYRSNWNPPGYRKAWDRCSMTLDSAKRFLGVWADRVGGQMVECVGWFDDDGQARSIAADFDNGKRLLVRCNRTSNTITVTGQRFD